MHTFKYENKALYPIIWLILFIPPLLSAFSCSARRAKKMHLKIKQCFFKELFVTPSHMLQFNGGSTDMYQTHQSNSGQ